MLVHPVSSEKTTADSKELAKRFERAHKRIRTKQAAPPQGQNKDPRIIDDAFCYTCKPIRQH
jgi:hypothetical protein